MFFNDGNIDYLSFNRAIGCWIVSYLKLSILLLQPQILRQNKTKTPVKRDRRAFGTQVLLSHVQATCNTAGVHQQMLELYSVNKNNFSSLAPGKNGPGKPQKGRGSSKGLNSKEFYSRGLNSKITYLTSTTA